MSTNAVESPSAPVRVGDVLRDQYRVEGVLGEGGMGTVYAVRDVRTKQAFAMKVVVDTKDEEHITRFFREGRATMRLKSDHVVRVYDVGSLDDDEGGTHSNIPFMVMERLDGKTLKELVDGKPLDERTVADLILQACEGLAHAHALGIVHRDVKPSNLFVMHGAEKQLKVLDFGISRMTSLQDWERTATVTETHALLGSPHYSSPEQLQNPSGVDARADIWSLGISMYYALSGKLPFGGSSLADLLVSVLSKKPASLSGAGRFGVSAEMSAIVTRCLERNIDKRYRNVADLADALAPHASSRRATLAERVKSLLANAPPLKRASAPPPAPAAAKTPRGVADRTLTVDEPLPDSAPAIPADASFEDTTTTTTKKEERVQPVQAVQPVQPAYPVLAQQTKTQTLEDIESAPTVAMPGGSMPFNVSVAPAPTPARSSSTMGLLIGGLALVVVIGLVIVGVTLTTRKTATNDPLPVPSTSSSSIVAEPTASTTSSPIPPMPPAASTPSGGDPLAIELELIADGRITKVIRPETRRMVVEEGKAIVTVAPFAKDLPIEVELANGARAKGTAKAGGSKSIHLTPTGGPRVGTQTKPGPAAASGAAKPAKSGSELHGSPYQ
jgi:serine/threonine protein kinase